MVNPSSFLVLTRKGNLTIGILELINKYIVNSLRPDQSYKEVVEVLDWIAGEVVKGEEG